MRYFSHELAYSFTHADRRGIFFTIKALFTRPGHMLREYILGHRANYFRPFPLLIILATLYGITAHLVEGNGNWPPGPRWSRWNRPDRKRVWRNGWRILPPGIAMP